MANAWSIGTSERATFCVLSSGPVTEFLKNMILPGTGKQGVDLDGKKINGIIRIVDDAVVTKRDLGNNFFVAYEGIGRLLARSEGDSSGTQSDDTMVTSDVQNVDRLISSNPTYFDDFTLVIGAQLSEKICLSVDPTLQS